MKVGVKTLFNQHFKKSEDENRPPPSAKCNKVIENG